MERTRTYLTGHLLLLFMLAAQVSPALSDSHFPVPIRQDTAQHMQQRIDKAFIGAQIQQNSSQLERIRQDLLGKRNDPVAIYWSGYTAYQLAICHLIGKAHEKSREVLEGAIESLNAAKNKNAEDYALLGLLQAFSAQFASGMQAGAISAAGRRNAERAIKLDPKNPRAYYVLGMIDFYTPEEYGGKKKAEEYLRKSISLPIASTVMKNGPSWGRNSAYELLVRHYLSVNDSSRAKVYLEQGLARFPEDYQLNKLSGQLN